MGKTQERIEKDIRKKCGGGPIITFIEGDRKLIWALHPVRLSVSAGTVGQSNWVFMFIHLNDGDNLEDKALQLLRGFRLPWLNPPAGAFTDIRETMDKLLALEGETA